MRVPDLTWAESVDTEARVIAFHGKGDKIRMVPMAPALVDELARRRVARR